MKTSAFLLLFCLNACSFMQHHPKTAPATSTLDFRSVRPAPGPAVALKVPTPVQAQLPNGLQIFTVQKSELPLVAIQIVVASGSSQDFQNMPGLASFVGHMLKTGTTSRTETQLAEELESLGAHLSVSVREESTVFSVSVLAQNFDATFAVLSDILKSSRFSPKEVERVRGQMLDEMTQLQDEPSFVADQIFRHVVFGQEHPYGHAATGNKASIQRMTQKELQRYYTTYMVPNNTAVVIAGDVTPTQAQQVIARYLNNWKPKAIQETRAFDVQSQASGLSLIDRKEASQSQLMIGHVGVSRTDPDYYALLMCNAILGGMFNSRINMNLREDKGITYGARSYFEFMRHPGLFFVRTGVRTDATEMAIQEIMKELQTMRATPVKPEELAAAKNRYVLSLPGSFQTNESLASMVGNLFLFDLPLDYYQQLAQHIEQVSIQDVQRVAEQHLNPQNLSIVVVGDKQKIEMGLADLKLGNIQLRDLDGNAL